MRAIKLFRNEVRDGGTVCAVVSDNEAVEVEIETILYSRAVNFRYQAAGLRKSGSIDTDTVAYGNQFLWRVS
jgi:hypothetical protein